MSERSRKKHSYKGVNYWIEFYPTQHKYGYDVENVALSGSRYKTRTEAARAAHAVIDEAHRIQHAEGHRGHHLTRSEVRTAKRHLGFGG